MSSEPRVWGVVPVKPFSLAKARLAPALSAVERACIARLMLEDVLAALCGVGHRLEGVLVPTADHEAAQVAQRFATTVLVESAPAGLNAAVTLAIDHLTGVEDAAMLVIPADLPQLRPDAIARAIGLLAAPRSVALAEADRDGGTNLLGCRPAFAITPRYGPCSFEKHHHAARAAGIVPGVLTSADLTNDLDRPDDLALFMLSGSSTRTHDYLTSLGIAERLSCLMSS